MKSSEKIKALSELYGVSVRTIQVFASRGLIPGVTAVKHEKRHAFLFSPELTEQLKEVSHD